MTRESPQNFDVIAIDAFSGDAIPLHLLTIEAIALYKKHLGPNGILAFHVSNQYLNLAPEIGQLARAANLQAKLIESQPDDSLGEYRATWILLTSSSTFFDQPELTAAASALPADSRLRTWTDDYSSILPILQLSHH